MTATELLNAIIANGKTCTRDEIDAFFNALSTDTFDNQVAMTLKPDDFGIIYTLPDGATIKVNS